MDVLSEDIRAVQFRERLRGYNPEDVDRFVDRMATTVQLLQEQLRKAVARAEQAEAEARERPVGENGAGRTLQLAQRAAELVLHDAEAEASRLVREAEERARTVVSEAEERAARVGDHARSELQADVSRLELARERLTEEVAALEGYLETERARAQRCLTEAALRLETTLTGLSEPPPFNGAHCVPASEEEAPPSLSDISDISHEVWPTASLAETD